MQLNGTVALVTGANRGIGAALTQALLAAGAAKVYAAARTPDLIDNTDVTPIRIDVTSSTDIAAAADACRDVTLLINNAGIGSAMSALSARAEDGGRDIFNTNVFGVLSVTRAFAPIIEANGGGTIVNILSVLLSILAPSTVLQSSSLVTDQQSPTRTRTAAIHVIGVHCGFVDTDLTAGIPGDKLSPGDVAGPSPPSPPTTTRCWSTRSPAKSVPASLTRLLRSTRNSCRGSGAGRTEQRRRLAWSILEPCAFGTGARAVPSPRRDRRRCGMEATRPVWSSDRLAGRWWCSIAAPELEFSAARLPSRRERAAILCPDRFSSGTPTGTTSRVCHSSNRSSAMAGGTCTGREASAVRWTRRSPVR